MKPSTSQPHGLPDIPTLRRLTQSVALLDAALSPEWQYRYYSFNSRWAEGEEMASMRNGSGDDWFLLFAPAGAVLKGLAHESALAREATFPRSIRQGLPAAFDSFVREPAFGLEAASFCLWRGASDPTWSVVPPADGPVAAERDGSGELLGILDGDPRTYLAWAQDYYERAVSLEAVQRVYDHEPLQAALVTALNPKATLPDLAADASEIGYPAVTYP